jgi:hypothetical protein
MQLSTAYGARALPAAMALAWRTAHLLIPTQLTAWRLKADAPSLSPDSCCHTSA